MHGCRMPHTCSVPQELQPSPAALMLHYDAVVVIIIFSRFRGRASNFSHAGALRREIFPLPKLLALTCQITATCSPLRPKSSGRDKPRTHYPHLANSQNLGQPPETPPGTHNLKGFIMLGGLLFGLGATLGSLVFGLLALVGDTVGSVL